MRLWIFAALQVGIALTGLAAWFLAENTLVTGLAAVSATILGVAQPILTARRQHRLDAFQEQQHENAVVAIDSQMQQYLRDTIEPPWPHRSSVLASLRDCFGHQANELMAEYDVCLRSIEADNEDAGDQIAEFADAVSPWAVGPYLLGLLAYRHEEWERAAESFREATSHAGWISPWLGWANALFHLGRIDELRKEHPHINGVTLLPYDAGNESSFLLLNESQRDEVVALFQKCSTALGNFYAVAEMCRSKQNYLDSREGYRRAA